MPVTGGGNIPQVNVFGYGDGTGGPGYFPNVAQGDDPTYITGSHEQQTTGLGGVTLGGVAYPGADTWLGFFALSNLTQISGPVTTENAGAGFNDVAVGYGALRANTIGWQNVAIGTNTLQVNTVAAYNTAIGDNSMSAWGATPVSANIVGSSVGLTPAQVVSAGALFVDSTAGFLASGTTPPACVVFLTTHGVAVLDYLSVTGGGTPSFNNPATQNPLNTGVILPGTTVYQYLGQGNVAVGEASMYTTPSGWQNVAIGEHAVGYGATAVNWCVGIGFAALQACTVSNLTAVGTQALVANTSGTGNVAVGFEAMITNTTGSNNTAIGYLALQGNTSSSRSSALGFEALFHSIGADNTAIGQLAGFSVSTGASNTLLGSQAGYTATPANATTTGARQTLIGYNTGQSSNTAVSNIICLGYQALCGGSFAMALGSSAQATAAGAIAIGTDHTGTAASSATQDLIVLGTTAHTTRIPGTPALVAGDKYLVVDSSGNVHVSALGPAS